MSDVSARRRALDGVPRLGWVNEPSPVEPLDALAAAHDAASLHVKRDDRIDALGGATKVRKFDTLFAQPPWSESERWVTVGAIGSGHVRACAAASVARGRALHAVLFDEAISDGVLDNLAWTITQSDAASYVGGRVELVARYPRALFAARALGGVTIPPGASTPWGTVGVIRAVAELIDQVRAGAMPIPDRLYVAYGSGGTVSGLAYGLRVLAPDWPTEVHAVRVVEGVISPFRKITAHAHATAQLLAARTAADWPDDALRIVRRPEQLGRGYGLASEAALEARSAAEAFGLSLEPVYTGKAFAALLADLRSGALEGKHALFWHTRRGPLPEPPNDWRSRLPARLQRRLAGASRRRAVALGAAFAASAAVAARTTGYATLPGFEAYALRQREGQVLAAAAEALFVGIDLPRPSDAEIAARIDRFVVGMPDETLGQLRQLLHLIEQGTLLGGRFARFTRLSAGDRLEVLQRVEERGGVLADAVRALRDLIYLGAYQSPLTWPALGYEGPLVPAPPAGVSRGRDGLPPAPSPRYGALRAPPGALPRAAS